MSEPPSPSGQAGLRVLQAWRRQGSILGALEAMHTELGDVFRLSLPRSRPVMAAGPQAARQILVTQREDFLWRNPSDPVTRLLRSGLLVMDGIEHDQMRSWLEPSLQRRQLSSYEATFLQSVERVTAEWLPGQVVDMLVEMRRLALAILVGALFGVDITPHLPRLLPAILRMLTYISPGPWLLAPGLPRPGYRTALGAIDDYLYRLIADRRRIAASGDDLLSQLVSRSSLDDNQIRDQMLTMFIAGHDTSTALLSWTLYLLGSHPAAMARAQAECRSFAGGPLTVEVQSRLTYLGSVVDEALRLYPPIHVANRLTRRELALNGFRIPQGTRVMLSIYLTHRDPKIWRDPGRFVPERFATGSGEARIPFSYLPFGGGPRNCIGAAFGKVESMLVLASILQRFDLELVEPRVVPHMGATLEPRPAVRMRIDRHGGSA